MLKTSIIYLVIIYSLGIPDFIDPYSSFQTIPANEKIDKAPPTKGNGIDQIDTLASLARKAILMKDLQTGKQYIEQALDLSKKNNLEVTALLHWAEAEYYNAQKDYWNSFLEMEKACSILKQKNQFEDLAVAVNYKANALLQMGKFKESIEIYLANYDFIKKMSLKSMITPTCREIAMAYAAAGQVDEDRKWTELFLNSALEDNDSEYIARAYFRKGDLAYADSNFVLSNGFFWKSLKIRIKRGDSLLLPTLLSRISWNYYRNRDLDSALKYYNIMAEISQKQNNYRFLSNALANIGTIYRDKKDNSRALFFYGKSTAFSLLSKDWYNLAWMNEDMSEMYRQMGDYKKAYECFVAFKNFSDSLSQEQFNMGLADARLRYETDTKAKELELATLKLDKQKYFIFALAGGILLLLVTAFLLYRQSGINARRKISEMNRKIAEITQANLRQQMNPHFIFNTLNSIQYYMYQHDKIATNNYLTKFSSLIRKTLEYSQYTSVSIKQELEVLQLYLELETLRFKDKFSYSIQLDEEIDPLMFKIPTMLIQPYVENAIIHGLVNKEGKGFLKILMALKKDHILCTIEDNGIGREAAMEIKRNKESHHQSLGTKITENRLDLVNGVYGTTMQIKYFDLRDDFDNPTGTRVEIQIPIMT